MSRLSYLLLATFIASHAEGRTAGVKRDSDQTDPLSFVKEIIYEANEQTKKENRMVVTIPDVEEHFFLGSFFGMNGHIGQLDTLTLRGNNQQFDGTDEDSSTVYNLNLLLGLEKLGIHYEYKLKYLMLLGAEGVFEANIINEAVRVKGTIISKNDLTCTASLESVELVETGSVQVDLKPSNLYHWVLRHVANFFIHLMKPALKNRINSVIAETVKDKQVQARFQKAVCKPFTI